MEEPRKRSDHGSDCIGNAPKKETWDLRPSIDNEVSRLLIRCFKSQLFEEQSLVFSQVRRETMDAHCKKRVANAIL